MSLCYPTYLLVCCNGAFVDNEKSVPTDLFCIHRVRRRFTPIDHDESMVQFHAISQSAHSVGTGHSTRLCILPKEALGGRLHTWLRPRCAYETVLQVARRPND